MKKIFATLTLLLCLQSVFSQVTYYKGEWTMKDKTDLFTGIFKIDVNAAGKVKAEIIWKYLAIDSTSKDFLEMYKDKKNRSGIEYAEGSFNPATNDFYFEGIKADDPFTILGLDKYHIKLAANKQAIYGTTETQGTNEGMLYAVKLKDAAGEKEFMYAKSKVKN